MVKRRGGTRQAHNSRAASEEFEGSKTISQFLNYRTPAEDHFVL